MAELSVEVPIKFSKKAQRDLYETCMAYKKLAEMRGAENDKLRALVNQMYRDMQGVLDMSSDTVWVDAIGTLRDEMDHHMQDMSALGIPPMDYEHRMRELGIEES